MTPDVYQDQMFGVIMTLYNLYRGQGLSHEEARSVTADFLDTISTSLRTLTESEETT